MTLAKGLGGTSSALGSCEQGEELGPCSRVPSWSLVPSLLPLRKEEKHKSSSVWGVASWVSRWQDPGLEGNGGLPISHYGLKKWLLIVSLRFGLNSIPLSHGPPSCWHRNNS